jgi:hypothetical protein
VKPELEWVPKYSGAGGARRGRDGARRWLERPVLGELAEERRRRGTGDGSTERELSAPVVRSTSTAT